MSVNMLLLSTLVLSLPADPSTGFCTDQSKLLVHVDDTKIRHTRHTICVKREHLGWVEAVPDAKVNDVADGSRVQVDVSPEAEREQGGLVACSADAGTNTGTATSTAACDKRHPGTALT